jgi:hypothetical protein
MTSTKIIIKTFETNKLFIYLSIFKLIKQYLCPYKATNRKKVNLVLHTQASALHKRANSYSVITVKHDILLQEFIKYKHQFGS